MLEELTRREQFFYKEVARMIRRINGNRSTIKREVYRTKTPQRYHAILHKVIFNYKILSDMVEKTAFMKDPELGSALACDILSGQIKNKEFKGKFRRILGNNPLKGAENAVFIRLNTLNSTRNDLGDYTIKDTCIPNVFQVLDDMIDNEDESAKKSIKDLYRDSDLENKIKFQNIASCLPAFILNPTEHSTVIDATAAPGNKATHLCSIMNNTGTIHAFERDKQRFITLKDQIENYGATNIKVEHMDFLKVDPTLYPVDYILLDPSCSGSGIHINYKKDQHRVDGLHNLQAMLLNHALKFNPMKLVYSTCSVHPEEGEDVVKEALEKNPEYEMECIGDFWKERGHEGYEFSDKVIRSERDESGKIGFFVALFKRKN